MDNDFKIVTLKGAERIRRRPAVVFGDDSREGATTAVKLLLNIFLTEAELGFCESLSLRLEDKDTVVIKSRDRGFLLDETPQDGHPAWYYDFCEFGFAPRENSEEYLYTVGRKYGAFYGAEEGEMPPFRAKGDPAFDLCCVQCVAKWMQVESVHKNKWKSLRFEKGCPVGEMLKKDTDQPSFTKISFQLDGEVFTDPSVNFAALAKYLRENAASLNGFECRISTEPFFAELFRAPEKG